MTCPECNSPDATAKKCHHCGCIFVTPERLAKIAAIRDATMNMSSEDLETWTARLKVA